MFYKDNSIETRCFCGHKNCNRKEVETCEIYRLPRFVDYLLPPKDSKNRKNLLLSGIIVTITKNTTDRALKNLFKLGVNILHIRLGYGTVAEMDSLMLKVSTAIRNHILNEPMAFSIALSFEIRGRQVRTGRLHNDFPVKLIKGERIILTSDKRYAECSVKEILFLLNFDEYLPLLKIGDYIFINKHRIQLVIVKITQIFKTITCCILRGGFLESYMDVTVPYLMKTGKKPTEQEIEDCKFALDNNGQFIIVPAVSDCEHYDCIAAAVKQWYDFANVKCGGSNVMLLANVNVSAIKEQLHLECILNQFNGVWINKFCNDNVEQDKCIIREARKISRPVVSCRICIKPNVPEELLDFHKFIYYESDCLLFKKFNPWIKRNFKQLLQKYHSPPAKVEDEQINAIKNEILKSNQSIPVVANCSILTTLLLDGKLIITITENGQNAINLSNKRPPCPILTVVTNRNYDLAKLLTLWKNVRPIVYDCKEQNEKKDYHKRTEKHLEFGLNYARKFKLVAYGDLVVYCFQSIEKNRKNGIEISDSFRVSYVSQENVYLKDEYL